MWALTGKPEGGRFRRDRGENGLQRSAGFRVEDPDLSGCGRDEELGWK